MRATPEVRGFGADGASKGVMASHSAQAGPGQQAQGMSREAPVHELRSGASNITEKSPQLYIRLGKNREARERWRPVEPTSITCLLDLAPF